MDKIELLAPAGDMERLKVTLLYGADAVYLGGEKYGLRANATNFSLEELKEACLFAHSLGKKIYFTLNIVFHNSDMDGVYSYIKEVVDCGVDAFIVSDPFIISYIKENYDVEVHLSTQNSTTNYETVNYFKKEGIDRVVLARELNKEEIKEIIDKTGVDIEIFIHGAMCTCFSGRCALSNYVTNRDANRGGCSQVCRFHFETYKEDFTIASKDLCLAEYIPEIIKMGVKSLKVEGRMRSIYYLATVIGSYRKLIDNYYNNTLTAEVLKKEIKVLERVANRETSSQFFKGNVTEKDQYFGSREEVSNQDYLGQVIEYNKEKSLLKIYERNYFKRKDKVELFTPSGEVYPFIINEIYDVDMNIIDIARHPDNIYYIYVELDKEIEEYSMIRLIEKSDLNELL